MNTRALRYIIVGLIAVFMVIKISSVLSYPYSSIFSITVGFIVGFTLSDIYLRRKK